MHRGWRSAASLAIVIVALASCASPAPKATPPSSTTTIPVAPPVPPKYQAMASSVTTNLDAFSAAIGKMAPLSGKASPPAGLGWAELLVANGNRQSALLAPDEMANVERSLDAFKHLGIGGVVLGIKVPLLLATYEPRAAEYADFYAGVARQARARGLHIDVELSALFCGTIYAACSYQYPDSVATWAQMTAQQAQIVIDRVHPDWLNLISEPNTEASLTRIGALGTISGLTQFVTTAVRAIGPHGSTKLAAGAASWYGPAYDEALVHTPIDGLVTHIYPANAATAANLIATAKIAHDAGKPLVADETWLYKGTTTLSGSVAASNDQGALCTYSFWEPLDVRFMDAVRQWAAKAGVPFISGFWSQLAFAYLNWSSALDARSPGRQLTASMHVAQTAMAKGVTSETGQALAGR